MKHQLLIVLILLLSIQVKAQSKITGNVSDELGVLSEANIIIKGTKKGTVSDLNGDFEIEVKPNDTLAISYLGFGTKEIKVENQKTIDVLLEFDNHLDEVEIIGYGLCRKICCGAYSVAVSTIIYESKIKYSTVYPNPSSSGVFNIKLLKDYKTVQIQVTNLAGQILMSNSFQNVNKKLSLDLSTFNSGIYIINIIADNQVLPAKKAIRG
ncbi:carboxypeptidase-like regulatory domain-containing protein [Olleya sp. YS]|uniref:T9SS type A sorting domain-containing protein n=1 Tax=Olleya sp. YS TaxID=3028318 RepID=UPI0024345DB6|nr:carboxypeptidase-like regulatory domain-containing protein [Olleya sp. YS]WGD35279.1 carboxypeptidase-like regulatory domain-containing protein [Olleya sp. YS]